MIVCMCICMWACVCVCVCVCARACACVSKCACVQAIRVYPSSPNINVWACACVCDIHVCPTRWCLRLCLNVDVCLSANNCVFVYIFVCGRVGVWACGRVCECVCRLLESFQIPLISVLQGQLVTRNTRLEAIRAEKKILQESIVLLQSVSTSSQPPALPPDPLESWFFFKRIK